MATAKLIAQKPREDARCCMLAVSFVTFALVSACLRSIRCRRTSGKAAYLSHMSRGEARPAGRSTGGSSAPLWQRYVEHGSPTFIHGDMGTIASVQRAGRRRSSPTRAGSARWLLMAMRAGCYRASSGSTLGIVGGHAPRTAWSTVIVKGYCFVLASAPTFWLALVALIVFCGVAGMVPLRASRCRWAWVLSVRGHLGR